MNPQTVRIGIDVGSTRHRVAVGLPDGKLIDEFDIDHHAANQWAEGFVDLQKPVCRQ